MLDKCPAQMEISNCLKKRKKENVEAVCQSCLEFKRERDFHFRKCKMFERQVADLEDKCADQEKLLQEAQKEIERLQLMYEAVQVRNVPEIVEDETKFTPEDSVTNDLHEMTAVEPRYEEEDIRIVCDVDVKMEPEEYSESEWDLYKISSRLVDDSDMGNDGQERNEFDASNWILNDQSGPSDGTDEGDGVRKPQRYLCPFPDCCKTLANDKTLAVHMRTHTGEKPFECPYDTCGRRFSQQGNLIQHIRIHTGKRPYKCTVDGCEQNFAKKANLTQHMTTHTGHRPFQCTFNGCGRWFSQKGNLKRHFLLHVMPR